MKNKTSLTLMELVIMLAVFALAAALCLHSFMWADTQSRLSQDRSAAYILAQNAAELIKYHKGDLSAVDVDAHEGQLVAQYDQDLRPVSCDGIFTLRVTKIDTPPLLGSAQVSVTGKDGSVLAVLDVCWQEVAEYE